MSLAALVPSRRGARLLIVSLLSLAILGVGALSAEAKKPETGFADSLYQSGDPSVRAKWLGKTKKARADFVRLTVSWRAIAGPNRPAMPRSSLDPSYDFSALDQAVSDARSRGLSVLLTVQSAPAWAEGENRPSSAPEGTWRPKPSDFGDFGHAIAERYSGSPGMPVVRFFQAWNEPSLSTYLTPQYSGKRNQSAGQYKRMLNAFYAGVNSAQPQAKVVTAGTAPYGDPAGGSRTRPLTFWRDVFCLKGGQRKLRPVKCKVKPRLDILAHHPINTSGGPQRSAININDASTPDFFQVRRILRAAERGNNIAPRRRGHPLWATELWWDTKPPTRGGIKPKTQAKWLGIALRSLARQGAKVVIGLRIRDAGSNYGVPGNGSGLFKPGGGAKPSFNTWRRGSAR